jgi:CheY-like chemotaxis protein
LAESGAGDLTRELLIVDDDEAQARLFAFSLEKLGIPHRCHFAFSGPEALEFLRRSGRYEHAPKPQLIILDVNMPGMDGCAVLREIKRDPQLRCIPVIMFSLATREDDFERCYREYANACIRKPDDYEGTLQVVREIERFWFHTVRLPSVGAR